VVRGLLAHVIHDRTCLASSLEFLTWPSILSTASLYALSYPSGPFGSVFNAALRALSDLVPINEFR
jgi:hypothetical protein